MSTYLKHYFARTSIFVLCLCVLGLVPRFMEAATLSVSPPTAVHTVGDTFTAVVRVNTAGDEINAAEGTLRFDPSVLRVVSVSRQSSIFSLWVTEPTFSNAPGTISFSGGLPAGYSGSSGTILQVTFTATGAGTGRLSFDSGAVLANDGRGSNVLTNMSGGSYTIQPQSTAPEPERIEYVAPANTPAAPVIVSTTHDDPTSWYQETAAELSWSLPPDVTAVRTLLDDRPTTVPTKVYEPPIGELSLTDLPEGESYLHIQFRNGSGWGRVTHYRLAVDTTPPEPFTPTLVDDADRSESRQTIELNATDAVSRIEAYRIQINDTEPFVHELASATGTLTLPALPPGFHRVIIDAIDAAGNERSADLTFTITAFERPAFTEYPTTLNAGVVPVIRGVTRPSSTVSVIVERIGAEPYNVEVASNAEGVFTFIPDRGLAEGVYELTAIATDQHGAQSEVSHPIRIAVQPPGYLRVGSFLVSVLSVVVPLVALSAVAVFGFWYLWLSVRRFRRRVSVESHEALVMLEREFKELNATLREQEAALLESRKNGQLTKNEAQMIEAMDEALATAQKRVTKEIVDVEDLTKPTTDKQ